MVDDATFTRESSELLPVLYRVSMSILHARFDAQDAVQQGLLKAWEHRNRARPESLRAWLTRIVINECRNIQRARMRVLPVACIREESPQFTPADTALSDAIETLPDKLKIPLLLRYMEQYSEREIALALGLPVTTVKNRLYRARSALKKMLTDSEVTFE